MERHGQFRAASDPRVESNTTVIEWVSGIYGIFWAVWLGYVTHEVTTECEVPVWAASWSQAFLGGVPVALALLLTAFTYFLTKWLWSIRYIHLHSELVHVFKNIREALFLCGFLLGACFLVGRLCRVSWPWLWMGIVSTIGWLACAFLVAVTDKRRWQ